MILKDTQKNGVTWTGKIFDFGIYEEMMNILIQTSCNGCLVKTKCLSVIHNMNDNSRNLIIRKPCDNIITGCKVLKQYGSFYFRGRTFMWDNKPFDIYQWNNVRFYGY